MGKIKPEFCFPSSLPLATDRPRLCNNMPAGSDNPAKLQTGPSCLEHVKSLVLVVYVRFMILFSADNVGTKEEVAHPNNGPNAPPTLRLRSLRSRKIIMSRDSQYLDALMLQYDSAPKRGLCDANDTSEIVNSRDWSTSPSSLPLVQAT